MGAAKKRTFRDALTAGIHAAWTELRPDLKRDRDEQRAQRLAYVKAVTGFEVKSLTELSEAALGDVLNAMRMELGPREKKEIADNVVRVTFGKRRSVHQGPPATVEPIAQFTTPQQVWAIRRIFDWLQFNEAKRTEWLQKKYRRSAVEKLSFKEGHSAIRLLLEIAVARWLKSDRGEVPVTKQEIAQNVEAVKRLIGIGRKGGGR